MVLEVVEQIHTEVVEAQIGDGNAGLDVFHVDDLLLEAAELLLPVGDFTGLGI